MEGVAGKYHVGVSGFSYPAWKGKFYPKELKNEEFLGYYSKQLETVEINSSFYAPPRAAVVESWAERTGEKFRFSFKAPKLITHVLKLGKGASEAAERFSKVLDSLGQRRGPILFQLPPFLKQDDGLLDDFLSETSGVKDRVLEFRHQSWFQESTYRLLGKHGAGLCIAETEEMEPVFQVTGGIAYFRLRNESYVPEEIDRWARKIRETSKDLEGYAYLRHDEMGENAVLAQRLFEKLQIR